MPRPGQTSTITEIQRSDHMTIRIGNAPCSWGVEFAGDPRNPAWREVLRQNAEAGYSGIELGPVGYMPEDPAILGEALAEHGLELIGGVASLPKTRRTASTSPTSPTGVEVPWALM